MSPLMDGGSIPPISTASLKLRSAGTSTKTTTQYRVVVFVYCEAVSCVAHELHSFSEAVWSEAGLYNVHMHFVYILESTKDKSHYVGSTENVAQRLADHNSGKAKYTSSKLPFVLKWFCAFPNKVQALTFEKYLKHGSGHAFAKKHLLD